MLNLHHLAYYAGTPGPVVVSRTATDALAVLDARLAALQAIQADAVLLLEALRQTRDARVSERVAVTDVPRLSSVRLFTDLLLPTDLLAAYAQRPRALLDALRAADQMVQGRTGRMTDTLLVADREGKSRQTLLADTLPPLDVLIKRLEAIRPEGIGLVDRAAPFLERRRELVESLALLDRTVRALQQYATETLGLADADRKAHERRLLDALPLPDLLRLVLEHRLLDTVEASDTVQGLFATRFRTVTEALSLIDVVVADFARKIGRVLTDTISLLESLQQQQRHRLDDVMRLTDLLVQQHQYQLADAARFSDAAQQARTVGLSDTAPLSEVVVTSLARLRAILDSLPIVDATVRMRLLQLAETVGLTDTMQQQHLHQLLDAAGVAEALQQAREALLTDRVTLLDNAVAQIGRLRAVLDALALADRVALYRERRRALLDTLAPADQAVRGMTQRLADSVGLSDTRGATLQKVLVDAAVFVESLIQTHQLRTADELALVDRVTGIQQFLARSITDLAVLADLLIDSHHRVLRETIGPADASVRMTAKQVLDAIGAPETLTVERLLRMVDLPGLSDTISQQRTLSVADAVVLMDRVVQLSQRLMFENVRLRDTELHGLQRSLLVSDISITLIDLLTTLRLLRTSDAVGLRVSAEFSFTKVLAEALGLVDVRRSLVQKIIRETGVLDLVDSSLRAILESLHPMLGLAALSARRHFAPVLGTNDYFGRHVRVLSWFAPALSVATGRAVHA